MPSRDGPSRIPHRQHGGVALGPGSRWRLAGGGGPPPLSAPAPGPAAARLPWGLATAALGAVKEELEFYEVARKALTGCAARPWGSATWRRPVGIEGVAVRRSLLLPLKPLGGPFFGAPLHLVKGNSSTFPLLASRAWLDSSFSAGTACRYPDDVMSAKLSTGPTLPKGGHTGHQAGYSPPPLPRRATLRHTHRHRAAHFLPAPFFPLFVLDISGFRRMRTSSSPGICVGRVGAIGRAPSRRAHLPALMSALAAGGWRRASDGGGAARRAPGSAAGASRAGSPSRTPAAASRAPR